MDAAPRILLVDDSKTIRESARTLLIHSGCEVAIAGDGFDALCRLAEVQPQLILMDVMMPRLDGFQTCVLIRNSQRFRKVPIVLVSSSDDLVEKIKAELAGAQRYLIKPFCRQDLLQAIRDFIPQCQLRV